MARADPFDDSPSFSSAETEAGSGAVFELAGVGAGVGSGFNDEEDDAKGSRWRKWMRVGGEGRKLPGSFTPPVNSGWTTTTHQLRAHGSEKRRATLLGRRGGNISVG